MSSGLRLVVASGADALALSDVGERLFVQAYGSYSPADDLAAHVRAFFGHDYVAAELQKPEVRYTMARDGDAIAGFVKIRRDVTPDEIPAADAIEVQQLYVDSAWQRRGVGRALMDWAVAAARGQGCAGLWLSVWQDADWATAFYERYGFRRVGTAEFWLGRTHFEDYLMWLGLDEIQASD
jgi:ribosomal protein S18 acetylase RimI-like enzyme